MKKHRRSVGYAIVLATVVLLLGLSSQFTAFAFEGFHDDTNEPCFMDDPFCAGYDGGGHVTTCKKCLISPSLVTCVFDSTALKTECDIQSMSDGSKSCSVGGPSCR